MQNSFNIVAKNRNNVEETFDFVQETFDFVTFDNVASTFLLMWTGFYTGAIWSSHTACHQPLRVTI